MVHIYNGILLSHKKEWNNAICNDMDGPRDCHSDWNKSDTKTNIIWYHLYVQSKKIIQINLFTKEKQTQRYGKQI